MPRLTDVLEADLIRVLTTFSPWWSTGKILEVEKFKRLDFSVLAKKVTLKGAVALVGARQVGKTTLMEQLIELLLKNGTDPSRILMIRANNTELNTISNSIIKDSIKMYEKYVIKEEVSAAQTFTYIFIDEIQTVEGWYNVVRDYYDISC